MDSCGNPCIWTQIYWQNWIQNHQDSIKFHQGWIQRPTSGVIREVKYALLQVNQVLLNEQVLRVLRFAGHIYIYIEQIPNSISHCRQLFLKHLEGTSRGCIKIMPHKVIWKICPRHPYVFLFLRLRRLRIRGSTVEHGDFSRRNSDKPIHWSLGNRSFGTSIPPTPSSRGGSGCPSAEATWWCLVGIWVKNH